MSKVMRPLACAFVAGVATYLWLLVTQQPITAIAGTLAIGVCTAVLMRSWWSLVLLPIAVTVGVRLYAEIACPYCRAATDDTPTVAFLLSFSVYGVTAIVGAAIGTTLASRRQAH